MQIKITEPGFTNFTGNIGGVDFSSGVSVSDVTYKQLQSLSASLRFVDNANQTTQVGAAADILHVTPILANTDEVTGTETPNVEAYELLEGGTNPTSFPDTNFAVPNGTFGVAENLTAGTIANKSATHGQLFTFTVPQTIVTDPNAFPHLTFTATKSDGTALPTWLVFDATNLIFSGTPGSGDTGTLGVHLNVVDQFSKTATISFNIVVA